MMRTQEMSNVVVEGGLRLYRANNGDGQELVTCIALAGDGTRIGIGDPVTISAGGATSIAPGPSVIAVTRGAATGPYFGVVVSVVPVIEGTAAVDYNARYRKASTAQYLLVRPARNYDIYSIQDDGAAAMSLANVGNNAKLVIADCDTVTGMSKCLLDSNNVASANATYPVKIVGVVNDPLNDTSSVKARWLVTINNAIESGGTGTAGI